jgi:hypothetical protein
MGVSLCRRGNNGQFVFQWTVCRGNAFGGACLCWLDSSESFFFFVLVLHWHAVLAWRRSAALCQTFHWITRGSVCRRFVARHCCVAHLLLLCRRAQQSKKK